MCGVSGEDGRVSSDQPVTPPGGVDPQAPPAAMPSDTAGELRPTGRGNARLGQTVTDMIRSLVVVLLVVGAILLVTWRPAPDPVRAVDPVPALTAARATAGFDVLYPADLGEGWTPTSVRWSLPAESAPDPAWHLGLISPQGDYVQIGQSATANPEYLASQIDGGTPRGEDPPPWQRYEAAGDPPTRALVTIEAGVTTVVSGTAPWDVLVAVAESLSPTAVPR